MAEQFVTDFTEDQPSPDINTLFNIASQAGVEALTPGEYEILVAAMPQDSANTGHYENLAEVMDAQYLKQLADTIIRDIDVDEESRKDWRTTAINGLKALGVNPSAIDRPKPWMSKAIHPMVKEALVQFEARAIGELWRKDGPADAKVLGTIAKETAEQAIRVRDYINYLYTHDMPGAFEEEEQSLWWVGFGGSSFKKVYYCPVQAQIMSVAISPHDLIVPWSAKNLRSAVRFAERYTDGYVDHRMKVAAGLYRKTDYDFSMSNTPDADSVQEAVDESEGRSQVTGENDKDYERFEANVYLDLPGYEQEVPLPYTVIVDKDSTDVLSIRRAWRENDPKRRRRLFIAHRKFLPSPGFYGWGLVHTIGSLGEANTRALQTLLDSAYLNTVPSGFTSRHTPLGRSGNSIEIEYGSYQQVDITPEQLSKAFFPLPFKEPSQTLFRLLGYVDDIGRRFASTTEAMVGENSPGTPVGTTLAMIEQGSKVISGVHKRLHQAMTEELKIVAELCYEYLPEQYPYAVEGQDRAVFKSDFDARIDVVPVSDPTEFSEAQRTARAQAQLQLATQFPQHHDVPKALKAMYRALRIEDPAVMEQQEIPPRDPISENMALLNGEPVKAYPDQDQVAYMKVLTDFWMVLDTETQKRIEPQYRALLQSRQALYYQQQVMAQMQALGIPQEAMAQPGVEQMLANVKVGMLLPFPDSAAEEVKDYEVLRDEERKDIKLAREMARRDALTQQQMEAETRRQSLALGNQRLQQQDTLEYSAMVHQLDLMKKQIELLMKQQAAEGMA